jgi:hypothetical protein
MIRELLALLFAETQAQIDDNALDELVDYLSIDKAETIQTLQHKGLAWAERIPSPSKEDLQSSAQWAINRATNKATIRGAIAGTVGFLSILPEQLTHLTQLLRLIQRLAIIYGINLESSMGQAYLIHSFAYMYNIPVPKQHLIKLKISELVNTHKSDGSNPNIALQYIVKQIVKQTLKKQGRKLIPGIGIIIGAYDAHSEMNTLAKRGNEFFSKRYQANTVQDDIEEAIEIPLVRQ